MALKPNQGFRKNNTVGVPIQSQEYSKNLSKQKLIKIARAKELLRQGLSKAEAMRVMVEEGLSNRSIKSTAGPAPFMKQAADELIAEGVKITPGTQTIGDGSVKRGRDRRYKATQAKSNKGMEIKMAVPKELKSNLQLSHAGGKYSPVGLHNLMYADGRKNLKMVKPFEDKIFAEMEKFNKVYEDVNAPDNIKRLAALEYAKSDRALRKKYPEYAKLKTRLSFKNSAFAPGFTVKEKLLDPSMAISNEPGTLIKGITPSSEKGKEILKLSKGNLNSAINSAQSKLITSTNKLPKADQLKFCSLLSKGGLPGDCKQALKADPEKAAKILSEAPVTSAAMKDVKGNAQKMIRLFRGEEPNQKGINAMENKYSSKLKNRFFFDNADDARWYAQRQGTLTGNVKSVDVPEKMARIGSKVASRRKGPNYGSEVILPKKFVGKEKLNIIETARARGEALTSKITFDKIKGAFINRSTGDSVSSGELKAFAEETPISVIAGTEDAYKPIKKSMLKTVGRTLAKIGAPLPTALIDGYFVGKQIQDDKSAVEIAKDPLNWLGLATMSTLTKAGGLTKAGTAAPGTMSSILRMGMNPGLIRGVSRFAGLPGLAVSTALTAYDQYGKYKNEEGFIYNLFNSKGYKEIE